MVLGMVPEAPIPYDFTLEKYRRFCQVLLEKYAVYPVHEYLAKNPAGHTAVLRHDVDRKILNSLRIAELEHEMGIRSTFYFRYPYTFRPEIMQRIQEMGHEIGYHYEVLAKAGGDINKAIILFEQELGALQAVCDIKTICMHGSPMSRYDNRDLWKSYDYKNFGIDGEAYLSFKEVSFQYFTDTGRSWNRKHSVRDTMPGSAGNLPSVKTTENLINWIRKAEAEKIYVVVHPERWSANLLGLTSSYIKDHIMNAGKSVITVMR
jgi:hypothetical protein